MLADEIGLELFNQVQRPLEENVVEFQTNAHLLCNYTEDAFYAEAFREMLKANEKSVPLPILLNPKGLAPLSIEAGLDQAQIIESIKAQLFNENSFTYLLLGPTTWRSFQIDWVLAAAFQNNSNVLAILLPTHPDFYRDVLSSKLLPPRLADNLDSGYCAVHKWTDDFDVLYGRTGRLIAQTKDKQINNNRPLMVENLDSSHWV